MIKTGNLVVYNSRPNDRRPLWNAKDSPYFVGKKVIQGSVLILDTFGLRIESPSPRNVVTWQVHISEEPTSSPFPTSSPLPTQAPTRNCIGRTLYFNKDLFRGQYICTKVAFFGLSQSGELVYVTSDTISKVPISNNEKGEKLMMKQKGALVLKNSDDVTVWTVPGPKRQKKSYLKMFNSGPKLLKGGC